jgi:hypothetical protein
MITLIIGVALASDPPQLPEPSQPVSGECFESHALEEGLPIPDDLVDGQVAACTAVVVPTSNLASLLAIRSYNEGLRDKYRLDTTSLEGEVANLNTELNRLNEPTPFFEQARTQKWIGVVEGVVIGIAAVYALQLVTE